jgi:HSP20 family molecular chaperone IbpA
MTTEIEKQKMEAPASREDISRVATYVPEADIYETGKDIRVFADLPGVSEKSLDIRVEKNILTIAGMMDSEPKSEESLVMGEYGTGRFERQFILTNEVDTSRIEATLTDGVLSLVLPKAEKALPRKITVKTA